MSEHASPFSVRMFSILLILFLLGIDLFTYFLQPSIKAFSHLAFGVLIAQFLCSLVFLKGEICNGQRQRLSNVHRYFMLFWLVWFGFSLFSNQHYVLTDLVCLCGFMMCLTCWTQPQEPQLRRSLLIMGMLSGLIGVLCYLMIFIELPVVLWLPANIFAQALVGVVLVNLALTLSRNRLQGFIGLLPLLMGILTLLNAIGSLILLFVYQQHQVNFSNHFALMLYFLLHLFIMVLIAMPIFRKTRLGYRSLLVLLLCSATLPLWASFAYIA